MILGAILERLGLFYCSFTFYVVAWHHDMGKLVIFLKFRFPGFCYQTIFIQQIFFLKFPMGMVHCWLFTIHFEYYQFDSFLNICSQDYFQSSKVFLQSFFITIIDEI